MEQRFYNNPIAFSILLGTTFFIYVGCIGPYSTGTITTLQRQFLFKSSEIGVLISVNDIVAMVTVTLTAYFGASRHRPRIMGWFTFLFAVGCVVSTIPQWVEESAFQNLTANANSTGRGDFMCDVTKVPEDTCSEKEKEESGAQHLKALWLYLGQALFGLASSGYLSLGISYLDDGVPRNKAPLYFAGIFIVSSLGSFVAFGLSAFSLSLHTDFYKINVDDLGYDDRDPRWIGAWWLGYLVYAGLFILLALPYFLFPKKWPLQLKEDEIELETKPETNNRKSVSADQECQTTISGDADEFGVVVKNGVEGPRPQLNGVSEKQNGHDKRNGMGNGYNKFDNEVDDGNDEKQSTGDDTEKGNLVSFSSVTGYLSAIRRLFLNFTFMALIMGSTCSSANLSGYYTFIGRYLQTAYDVTPADVSIILSAVSTPTSVLGIMFSSVLINRMNLKLRGLLNLAAICKGIAVAFVLGNFAVFCGKALIAGVTTPYPGSNEISLEAAPTCMANCECEKGVYTPVCGSDGLTYVTPCHAGCTGIRENDHGETVYTNCTCVSPTSTASPLFEGPLTAVKNQCPRFCRVKIIVFIVLYCVSSFAQSSMGNSVVNSKLRVVENRDKALALALGSFFNKVLAYIPAPIYYGLAIQSTCAMFQESCGETGNCLIYDTDRFSTNFWGLFCGLGVATVFCYAVASFSLRRNAKGEYYALQLHFFGSKSRNENEEKE
ncbi:solute carrier organic anion transporter family member 2A1-like [Lytechinus variegatus]|uniref:solute carrier organic anion transporter family member 2A1-like n=1 Tax=Lytechinus variegatus TaxID=7654 RepID=UPI001BB2A643|nr:solute carrier organic anion transporter family member 2A1-like [Lytechinus variegatus]